jgi:hypothetical protein
MADTWRDAILLTLREMPSKNKEGSGWGLWVVMKVRNDTCYNVSVRAGSYYTDKVTGERRIPRDGLTSYDFAKLKEEWAKVKPLLDRDNPPPVPAPEGEQPQDPPQGQDALEDPPF